MLEKVRARLKKIWRDSVFSEVIAGAILAIGALFYTYFSGWWPSIAALASKSISLVLASTLVPNWLLVPICLLAALGMFTCFVRLSPSAG